MTLQTIGDLKARLADFPDDTPIAFASQPGYPLEYTIAGVEQADDGTVYLIEGTQIGYLSGAARDAMGW